eukprot:gene19476-23329_t
MKGPRIEEGQKKLNVAVIGAPNAGKSSLVNSIVGEKVCAVSSREHTTRDSIIGIYSADKTQVVFHDTPGIIRNFDRKAKIREFVNLAWNIVKEADIDYKKDFVLVLNKVDMVTRKEDLLDLVSKLNEGNIFADTFVTSATNEIHVDTLRDFLVGRAIDGPWEFDNELVAQNTIGWTIFSNNDIRIDQDLIVKKQSHKSCLLGRDGAVIKSIYLESKKDLEKVFNRRIHLFLTVKVKKGDAYDEE